MIAPNNDRLSQSAKTNYTNNKLITQKVKTELTVRIITIDL